MTISKTKGQGRKAINTQKRKASDLLTSTLAAFLFSSHPKRENDRELIYIITLAPTTGGFTPQDKTKSNTTKKGMHP